MKKTILVIFGLLIIFGLAAIALVLNRRFEESRLKLVASQAAGDSLRTRFDAALAAIAEVQDSLSAIMPSESQVLHLSQSIEPGGKLTQTRKDQVLRSISDLNESIRSSKEMIRRLETRLKESSVRIEALERIIDNLKRNVSQREEMVRNLTSQVESLKIRVASLITDVETGKQQIRERDQVIEDKRREISTISYIIGTKKRLKQLGVIESSGGFGGMGKTSRLSGRFDPDYFTSIDTDEQTVVRVAGRKPVVLTAQSRTSYALVPVSQDWSELRILDPAEFRKVKYLVIQVD